MKKQNIGEISGLLAAAAMWVGVSSSASGAMVFDLGTIELTASAVTRSGDFNPNPITVLSDAKGYGGFSFDFDFDFATAGGNATTRFTQRDSVTRKLTRSSRLSESDFKHVAPHDGRDFYRSAHINSINSIGVKSKGSAFVGAKSASVAVPEPSTMIVGALLLLPFGASTIRILRGNRKA